MKWGTRSIRKLATIIANRDDTAYFCIVFIRDMPTATCDDTFCMSDLHPFDLYLLRYGQSRRGHAQHCKATTTHPSVWGKTSQETKQRHRRAKRKVPDTDQKA